MRSVRTSAVISRSFTCDHGPTTWFTKATASATSRANAPSGFMSAQTFMPPAVMTISSLSPLSLLRT